MSGDPRLNVYRDEPIVEQAVTRAAVILATQRRLAILMQERVALDIPFERLRRVQFDIERERAATLVIVPERPTDEPQVLMVHADEYAPVANVLVHIGRVLAEPV